MPAPDPSPGDIPAPRAALVALAAALDPRDFATSLTAPAGQPPTAERYQPPRRDR